MKSIKPTETITRKMLKSTVVVNCPKCNDEFRFTYERYEGAKNIDIVEKIHCHCGHKFKCDIEI